MLLIPAIDLQGGKCVRLRQGEMDDVTVFSENPVEMARQWFDAGARRLHIVDLDGALSGEPENADVIHEVVEALPEMDIQVGGGIRDEDSIEAYLNAGVRYVILGTKAVNAPHFVGDVCVEFPGHIIVGLDARDGKVATDGWSKLSHHDVIDIAKHFEQDGVEAIIFTDIGRDGMMSGVNVAATAQLAAAITIPVIASGGVTDMKDIDAICEVEEEGVQGVIIGRAIYEGTLDLKTALDRVASRS
ncbi:MAG: 1-(5-phosphoribosyl)-5-[(5-phosphoribosylamino)methylideneamino]imidazole-4-carboxamide isomerase [Immundisolibacteraceae bacterium]|nr:1-(5-phosphoribosyl)-5-[(5-phosphoribosylamino)methylideneamino]imidazole-4-carboxamide isomerase [Immundisolibacteraceae bacterium]